MNLIFILKNVTFFLQNATFLSIFLEFEFDWNYVIFVKFQTFNVTGGFIINE